MPKTTETKPSVKKEAGAKAPVKKEASVKKATPKEKPVVAPKVESKKAAVVKSGKTLRVTQIGSPIHRPADQRQTLVGLGLNKMHRTRVLEDTPAIRGMLRKVHHMVQVEEA